jgi:hypothetical protein
VPIKYIVASRHWHIGALSPWLIDLKDEYFKKLRVHIVSVVRNTDRRDLRRCLWGEYRYRKTDRRYIPQSDVCAYRAARFL